MAIEAPEMITDPEAAPMLPALADPNYNPSEFGTAQLTPEQAMADRVLAPQGPFPTGSLILAGAPDVSQVGPQGPSAPWMQGLQQWEKQHRIAQAMQEYEQAEAGAKQFVAQRQYVNAIAGGTPPAEALATFGPAIFGKDFPKAMQAITPAQTSEVMIGGQRFAQVRQPSGNISIRPITDTTTGGPVQSFPVFAPGTTNVIPGMVALPRGIVRNVPQTESRPVSQRDEFTMLKTINDQLEKSRIGVEGRIREGMTPEEQALAKQQKKDYEANAARMREIAKGLGKKPTASVPKPRGREFKDPSGKTWIYTGTSANPLTDTTASNWQEAP